MNYQKMLKKKKLFFSKYMKNIQLLNFKCKSMSLSSLKNKYKLNQLWIILDVIYIYLFIQKCRRQIKMDAIPILKLI